MAKEKRTMTTDDTSACDGLPAATRPPSDVPAALGDFTVMALDPPAIREVIHANLGGRGLDLRDFDTVRVAAGGATQFLVPDPGGERSVSELVGVIIHHQVARRYWPQSVDDSGGSVPPACVSEDGERGVGSPGGLCVLCPYSQWCEDEPPACTQRRLLWVLTAGDVLPMVLDASPTSIRNIDRYFVQLARKAPHHAAVLTRFTVERDQNKDGQRFGRIAPAAVGMLAPHEVERMKGYSEILSGVLRRQPSTMAA